MPLRAHTQSGFTGGTTHYYRVIATSNAGDSDPSDTVSATTDNPSTGITLTAVPASVAEDVAGGTATVRVTARLNGSVRVNASTVTVTVGGSNLASAVDYDTGPRPTGRSRSRSGMACLAARARSR